MTHSARSGTSHGRSVLIRTPVCRCSSDRYSATQTSMDHLLGALLEIVFGTFLVGTGRVIVAVLTLGRWRGASMFDTEESVYGAAGALSFVRDGQRVVTTTGTGMLGFLFYVALATVLIAFA